MNPPAHTEFTLTRSIYFRAIHVLNRRSRDLWQSDMAALRTAMDLLIESEYSKELENFSNEFADRLVQEGGWELQFFPTYLRDEDDPVHVSHDDVKVLLKNWSDPTLQPDGYPDQKFSDIEALVSRHELCDVDNGGWNITKSPYRLKKEPNCRASQAKARTQRPRSSMP